MMAAVKKYVLDTDGGLTSAGTDTITISTNRAISSGDRAQGFSLRFKAGGTNTGAATLNVDSLGAVAIKRQNGDALSAGDIVSGGIYDVAHDGTNYKLIGANAGATGSGSLTGDNTWSGANTFTGSVTVGDGSGDVVVIKGTTVNSFMSGLLSSANTAALYTAAGTVPLVNGGTGATTASAAAAAILAGGVTATMTGAAVFQRNGGGTAGNTVLRVARTDNPNSSGDELVDFFCTIVGVPTQIGSITINGSPGVTYNTTSDARLKPAEFRRPIDDSGEIIDGLNPVYFQWMTGHDDFGFIAQEAYAVSPFLAKPGEGEPGDDDFKPWMMEKGRMEAIHTAELQALRKRVAALEAA